MTIFAQKYTQRAFTGTAANIYKIVNTLLTVVPLGIITFVLWKLFTQTFASNPNLHSIQKVGTQIKNAL